MLVSKALSIEREDEDIQATRGQVGRTRQFPQPFQVRQDPNKRQVVPTSSGQLSYRPVRQQWQAVRLVISQPGQQAARPPALAQNNQFVPRGVQPLPVRPQGQVVRPQGQIIRLQQVQQPGQANSSQIKCFNCNEMGHMKRQCPKLPRQMGFSAPQTQGTLYTIVTEDTPVEEMPREDALLYAITQEDASASDQVVEDLHILLSIHAW
ncbi:zinc finger protein [Macleaya cordata]|uniref:Zinc finger protein n=1 Tax=Macleaya cordata TaxID=56857 RepID=A0A200R174_MACCD|nr:zinc finger protein [Macleaya cordata]